MEVTRRRGRKHKQLLDDLKEKRSYWNLNCLEDSLWKRLWTCRKTEYVVN